MFKSNTFGYRILSCGNFSSDEYVPKYLLADNNYYWYAFLLVIHQGFCREIALVDMIADKLQGELLDMQHCQRFVKNVDVQASTGKYLKKILC